MKLLHVWNIAGVASVLSKYLRQRGIQSDVITKQGFDNYDFEDAYPDVTTSYAVRARRFYTLAIKQAADYDIIHIHAIDEVVPLLKLCRWKPIVLHYHGTDIRGRSSSWKKRFYRWFSDHVLVSTPDLMADLPSATYLPNPVDTDLFHPYPKSSPKRTAVFFLKPPDGDAELNAVKAFAKDRGLQLHAYSRFQGDRIPHQDMPRMYAEHKYFIDRVKLSSLSRMALEALASGMNVWKNGKLLTELPREHQPEQVIEQLILIYEDLLAR